MFRKQNFIGKHFVAVAGLALCASGLAHADDSSMRRFGGDSYTYFANQPVVATPANPEWRQSHPNGLTERELQAVSSSDLSAFAAHVNPPVFASAPADPLWRQSHPNGLTQRELLALSSSSVSVWQMPDRSAAMMRSAGTTTNETPVAR
jgi:hypothetical protein